MRKLLMVVLLITLTACASPHPPTGVMWTTIATVDDRPVAVGYAPAQSVCEDIRTGAMRTNAQMSDCKPCAAVPYRGDAGVPASATYWTVAASASLWAFPSVWHFQRGSQMAAVGFSARARCDILRAAVLQALRHVDVTECEQVVVTPLH